MRDIITDNDCDASARCFAVMFFKPAERIAPAPRTTWHVRELNCCINKGFSVHTGLTHTAVAYLEILDDPAHDVSCQEWEVDHDFQVFQQSLYAFQACRDPKVVPLFNYEVLAVLAGAALTICLLGSRCQSQLRRVCHRSFQYDINNVLY